MGQRFEDLKAAQLVLAKKINETYINFCSRPKEKQTRGHAQSAIQRLEEYFNTFNSNQTAVLKLKDLDYNDEYFTTFLNDVEDYYYENKGQFNDFMLDQDPAQTTNQSLHSSAMISSTHSNLPPMKVPEFCGKYTEWESYRDLFLTVINKADISAVDKFYYLKSNVKGKAKEIVDKYKLTAANYTLAWNDLVAHYENKRRLVNTHLGELFNVKPMKAETAGALNKLRQDIDVPLEALKALGRPTSQWSDIIIYLITSRFEANTAKEWQRFLTDSRDPPTLEELDKFINSHIVFLEALEPKIKVANKEQSSSGRVSSCNSHQSSNAGDSAPKELCPFCKQSHFIAKCEQFLAIGPKERSQFAKANELCMRCLRHQPKRYCNCKKTCHICKYRHHKLLHYSKNPKDRSEIDNSRNAVVNNGTNDAKASCSQSISFPVRNDKLQETKICAETSSTLTPSTAAEDNSHPYTSSHSCDSYFLPGVLLATAIVKVQADNGIEIYARALIDDCSQASIISTSLCQRLKLKTQNVNVPMRGTGGVLLSTLKKLTQVIIKPRFRSSFSCRVDTFVIPKVSCYNPPSQRVPPCMAHLDGLVLADPQFMEKTHIDILLGAAVYSHIIEGSVIKGSPGEPIATRTALGWLLSGEISHNSVSKESDLTSLHISQDCRLDDLLQKFWLLEEVPSRTLYTKDEEACEKHFAQTHSRDDQGRFILRLPFKNAEDLKMIDLSQSYYPSQKMLLSMERKFQIDPVLNEMYHCFLYEYEDLGHMTQLPKNEVGKNLNRFYIPHHGIWKDKSSTTKLRTVFNGSLKLSNPGISLNDLLHSGANLLPILADLITNWRHYKYVFVADIEKMYRQILIHPDDRQYQCILWRFNSSDPIHTYTLNTVTYGLVSSPYQANRTLSQLAIDHMFEQPWGAEVLRSETYMDDILSGGHSLDDAFKKQQSTTNLLKLGGFSLHKYMSNHPDVLRDIPLESYAVDFKSFKDSSLNISVLGITWYPSEDDFHFDIIHFEETSKLTKRIILSRTARLFDPLGWLAPIIIVAKIIMQRLWQEKKGWDEEIGLEHRIKWVDWERQLTLLSRLKVPRWTGYDPHVETIEIHGFADASKLAYGACLYLRTIVNKQVFATLLAAKSKVAPLKLLSIPRLELAAAYLLAKLSKHYLESSKLAVSSSHLWSDSTDVLQWLKSHPSRWRPYVAHRCASILEDMPDAKWHYVKSRDNPADVVSRGCTADELLNKELWWQGPKWLKEVDVPWRTNENESIEFREPPLEEISSKEVKVHLTIEPKYAWDLMYRYSSLFKLIRITSYCLRFVLRVLNPVLIRRQSQKKTQIPELCRLSFMNLDLSYPSKIISPAELSRSRCLLVYLHQSLHFPNIVSCFKGSGKLPKTNSLLKLNPFLEDDLLRVGGRLANAQLPYDNKHPLLLHPYDVLTRLIIEQAHTETCHGGTQLTLGTIRLQYWIVNGRVSVKSVINRCVKCRVYSKKRCSQLMGHLPSSRTTPSKAFAETGVDYAGPIKLRLAKVRGNITQKGYIAIFVCFSTHAIHIEIVEDYSSAAFIAAFHRFTSRRGHCLHLHSDKGTTFVGAESLLRQMLDGSLEWAEKVQVKLAESGTQWHYNPPGAPHFGGLWESAVKSMKYHVYRMIGEQALTFVELSTLLCRVEAILNSRPLLPLADDVNDLNPLTPAHFLIQRPSYLVPEPDYREEKIPLSKRWENLSKLIQNFWDRWSREYLSSLQIRQKWKEPKPSLKVGDIVRIMDEASFPGRWPLGIVKAIHPDKEGLVRAVTLKTSQSELKRPVVKLILLERSNEAN